ncbi:hypothetical protein Dimus_005572 [Dionaea muscipula]
MAEPGLILEENHTALTDSLEGRGSPGVPSPDPVSSPTPARSPLRPDPGTFLVGTGSLDEVAFTEAVISMGEEMVSSCHEGRSLNQEMACVVRRGGAPVVAGDEPPSGLQVCPPSPLLASFILCDVPRRSAGAVDGGIGQGLGSLNMVESIVDMEEHSITDFIDADCPLGVEDVSESERECVGKPVCGTPELATSRMESDDAMTRELRVVGDFAERFLL